MRRNILFLLILLSFSTSTVKPGRLGWDKARKERKQRIQRRKEYLPLRPVAKLRLPYSITTEMIPVLVRRLPMA